MSSLLIAQSPLVILPELAAEIGLNEAVILQQIHYWIEKKRHVIEGKSWVYNTYESWQAQFPFWSVTTIRRTLKNLESKKLLQTGNFNIMAFDQTKWYTINYEAIGQFGKEDPSNRPGDAANLPTPIPKKNQQKLTSSNLFLLERQTFEQSLGKEKVAEAEAIARAKGITAWAYIRKILLNWEQEAKKPARKTKTECLPDWFGQEEAPEAPDSEFERDRRQLEAELARRLAKKAVSSQI